MVNSHSNLKFNIRLQIVNGTVDKQRRDMYLGVYGGLGIGQGNIDSQLYKHFNNIDIWFQANNLI